MRGWKKISHANGNDKKVGVAILISDKIDFKMKGFSFLQGHWNHNKLLNNHQQENPGTHQIRYPTSTDKGEAAMRR